MTIRRIPKGVKAMPDDLLYQIAHRLLRSGYSHADLTAWLKDHHKLSTATREWPRACLAYAYERKLITIAPREASALAYCLAIEADLKCRVSSSDELAAVADLAADQACRVIEQVRLANEESDEPRRKVHVGISAGGTIGSFSKFLAERLEDRNDLPQLVFHALTSGFDPRNPMNTPAVTLGSFSRIRPEPEFSVLLSEPLVPSDAAKRMHTRPFLKNAYERAKALDIVVTSLSVADHPHSMFVTALEQENPGKSQARRKKLSQQDWAGDIMWRPYSRAGRTIEFEIEPVSVVRFDDLVRMSNDPRKHVICIAGNCAECSATKTSALTPFVRANMQGRRPFSHLVTTSKTAQELCEELEVDVATL